MSRSDTRTASRHRRIRTALAFGLAVVMAGIVQLAAATDTPPWRIAIRPAAIVANDTVLLGEIADPAGEIDPSLWQELSAQPLWPAPERQFKPMQITKSRLHAALLAALGDEMAALCSLPSALALQRGGAVLMQDQIAKLAVNALTTQAASLGGEAEFRDFKLPAYIFLSDPANRVDVELAQAGLKPGRVALRFTEMTLDNRPGRKYTGGVLLDIWATVPAAARPLNNGDELTPERITFIRKNLAYLRGDIWDGRGGPWRIRRPIGQSEPIYAENIEGIPMVRRGDKVRLTYVGKNVRLEVPAEALADGGFNASIPVRNLQTKVQVFARVQDAQTVQVW